MVATSTGNRTAAKFAEDLTTDLGREITLADLQAAAEGFTIRNGRTPLTPERQEQIKQKLATEASAADPPPAEQSQDVVTTRKRQSKGAFEPTRLMKRGRLKLTDADRLTLQLMQRVLQTVKKFDGLRREPTTGRRGQMGLRDLLMPGRWMWMELAEYQARAAKGTLPLLHPDTLRELAEPLSRLSLVNHTCRICNQPLEPPHYKGMLEHLLAGNAELPFRPNDHKALKFAEFHHFCPFILEMMAEVEVELNWMAEDDAKEAARWRAYMARLQADENRMLVAFMQSEHRPLSGGKAMARFRAINDHVKRQRELYS